MSLIDSISEAIPVDRDAGPNRYQCPECDREFEVDAPPKRVVCSNCGTGDVERLD